MHILSNQAEFVIYAAYALIGISVFLLVRMLLEEQESRAAQENLSDLRNRKSTNFLVKILRVFFTQYIVPIIREKPFWDKKRKEFSRKLIAAGLKEELTPDEYISFKILLILFFPISCVTMEVSGIADFSWYTILGSGAIGWFYPNFWVSGQIQKRQKKILRSMPFIVDLLALSTEAGLDFIGAISKVVEKSKPSPMIDELSQMLKEIKVGSSRQEALRELAIRISMTEINSFTAILISADQMGASIGKILKQQSEQIRTQRMLRAEKAGAAAAQKVILPLVLFILPAVMLMVFGPFGIGLLYPQ
jgi:tight adherence protein C